MTAQSGRLPVAIVVVTASFSLTACSPAADTTDTADSAAHASTPPARSATSPSPAPATTSPTPVPPGEAARRRMTLRQQVGQLFMTGADASTGSSSALTAINTHHVGNIMLRGRTTRGAAPTRRIVAALQAQVTRRSTNGTRLLVATDQEGGSVQVLRGPGFDTMPSGLTQGGYGVRRLRARAERWGRQLHDAGVNMNLAPVLDTVPSAAFAPHNAPIGAFQREYGYTPRTVARHGRAFLRGMTDAKVEPTIKHFPGLGRVTANTDVSANVTDRTTTSDDAYLRPFRAGISAGAPFVMMSTASYARIDGDRPAAFSKVVIGDVLRTQLGFDGVVISDDLSSAKQVASLSPGARAVHFIAAGGDMVLAVDPGDMPAMVSAVLAKARSNPSFAANVKVSVARVLAAKQRL